MLTMDRGKGHKEMELSMETVVGVSAIPSGRLLHA